MLHVLISQPHQINLKRRPKGNVIQHNFRLSYYETRSMQANLKPAIQIFANCIEVQMYMYTTEHPYTGTIARKQCFPMNLFTFFYIYRL